MINSDTCINVKWQLNRPTFVQPSRFISWPSALEKSLPREPSHLESSLGLSAGTLALLNEAFEQSYPRSQGWQCESKDELALGALKDAARIYKRGVATDLHTTEKPLSQSGQYEIGISRLIDDKLFSRPGSFVVIDKNVLKHWPSKFESTDKLIEIEALEHKKTLDVCAKLTSELLDKKPNEVLIIGGGIVCDVTAFACYLAGVPFSLVPTTLLAMADASVGGKTGVNFPPYGKNQVGAFAFPRRVYVFTQWLETLSERDFLAGLAECLKHALISGDNLLLEDLRRIAREKQYGRILEKIEQIIKVKAQVISRDPEESGERAVLNLGHTFGHAIEILSQYNQNSKHMLHGEAVGLGLLFTAILSHRLGLISDTKRKLIKTVLLESGLLPTVEVFKSYFIKQPQFEDVMRYIEMDKKNQEQKLGESRWVLLSENGIHDKGGFTHNIKAEDVQATFQLFLQEIHEC